MESAKDRLKHILLRDNLLTPEKLQHALEEQKMSGGELSRILLKLKLIDENTLSHVLSEALELPLIDVSRLKIDQEILKLLSQDVVNKHKVMPVSLLGDRLTVAVPDPLNIVVIDTLRSITGYAIIPIISMPKNIEAAILKNYSDQQGGLQKLGDIIKGMKEDSEEIQIVDDSTSQLKQSAVEQLSDEAPIIKLTDTIIQQAVLAKASDVFVEPMEKTVRVRYRIDGVIREIDQMAKVLINPIVSRIKVISNLDISEHRLPQDGRFKTVMAGNREVDFRVSILPTALGEKICLRILDQAGSVLDVDRLGFEPESLKRLKECMIKPHGMILTCGPTGSGKTTTLYSILKAVDSIEKNIVTVEDPVEYQMRGLNQVNIRPAMGLTFAASLRSILRQDPNIIMIGEIRDTETLDIAVKAALTGHLVLSSLHTTTAAGSIIRMINMGIQPFLICSSVLAIIAQRLLRKVCVLCREQYDVPETVAEKVGLTRIAGKKISQVYRAKGCKKCFNTGYQGRVGITEILVLTPLVKELILARAGEFKVKDAGRKEGMRTMREDGLAKVLAGLTTLEEVLRVTASDEAVVE
jgi:type IV pilus assembly protein PilB